MSLLLAVSTAMIISAVLARIRRGRTFFRVTFFLPNVVSLAVVAVIWGQLYDPLVGPITLLLNRAGLGGLAHLWLGDPATVLPAISVGNSWQSYGFYMVILLAGLQGIDVTLYEAATADGAGAWSLFWHITIPGLRNVLNLVLILAFINALHGFTMVWVMTQGGPMLASDLLATYIYRVAFGDNNLGVATAASVVLSLVVILTTRLFNRLREEEIG
jgi:raffinose/stachyose/melibiose transport system permease protein